ncbi:MAG: hypothetical protein ACXWP4_19445 [Polyangiales bacterium]
MRRLVLFVVLAGCGARVDEQPIVDAVVEDTVADTFDFDLGTSDTFVIDDAPATDSMHPIDGDSSCATRRDACALDATPPGLDSAQYGLQQLARDCLSVEVSCGAIHVNLGSDGCVLGYWLTRPERTKFAACVAASLATVRFACASTGELSALIDSCTVK